MNFKRVFRGYDPEEVDKYIAETAQKEQQLRTAQKERIDELADENYALRRQVEQAISKSLIASQHLAEELKFDAERYADLVLSRAKIFYATWRAYARTLLAALSEEEVRQFNVLRRKIEAIIDAYEGKDVAREMDEHRAEHDRAAAATEPIEQDEPRQPTEQEDVPQATEQDDEPTEHVEHAEHSEHTDEGTHESEDEERMAEEERWRQARAVVDVTPSEATMSMTYSNPISKVEQASGQVIDLRELTRTDMSLEDLCAELGLIVKK